MASMLDIIMSVLLGGLLFIIIINANDLTGEITSMYGGDVLVQEMLITQAQFVEGEFRNMGFGVPQGSNTVLAATDTSVTYLMALNMTGSPVSQVTYYLGSVNDLPGTRNDLDRKLWRSVDGGAAASIGVVTFFHLRYMTVTGDTLATPVVTGDLGRIREIELSMEVQNPFALARHPGEIQAGERKELYSTSYWQQTRLASQNFKR